MNDIIIVGVGLAVVTSLTVLMLKYNITFADIDARWNEQFEKFGAWFMRMVSPFDDRWEK